MLPLTGHGNRVRALAYAPDGLALASGGADGTVRVWDLLEGAERLRLTAGRRPVLGVAWSLDGEHVLASDHAATIRAWETRSGLPRGEFDEARGGGEDVLRIIVGEARPNPAEPGRLRRAEAAAWRLAAARGHYLPRWGGVVYPPQANIIKALIPRRCFPFRKTRAKVLGIPARAGLGRLRDLFSDGLKEHRYYFPATEGGTRRGDFVPGSGVNLHDSTGDAAVFSPDGDTLVRAADRAIQVWEIGARRFATHEAHTKPVRALAFSPDGRLLATGAHDGRVGLWDVSEKRKVADYDGQVGMIDAVAFSPDGSTVAAGGRTGIVVWDVAEDDWR